MKKHIIPMLTAVLSTALLVAGISSATADEKKAPTKKTAKAKKKKSPFYPFRGKIKAVDAEKKTVTLPGAKGKPDRVFRITEATKLRLDGKSAKFADVKSGLFAGGRAKKAEKGTPEATTLNVRTKLPEKKKKKPADGA
tara:strand:+ start:58 stop:474 length:417 start_codon:yes stop_codon:yes gene_type:complete